MARRDSGLSALSAEERGCLLGASLLGLEEPAGLPISAEAWSALRGLSKAERAALLAKWIADLQAPLPTGMERLHPSWVAEALASEPEDLWPALMIGLPNAAQVRACFPGKTIPVADGQAWHMDAVAEMQRHVFLGLAVLCVIPSGPIGARLCRLSSDELLAEIDRRAGATTNAHEQRSQGLAAIGRELMQEGAASLLAVAGRMPAVLGHPWLQTQAH